MRTHKLAERDGSDLSAFATPASGPGVTIAWKRYAIVGKHRRHDFEARRFCRRVKGANDAQTE